MVIGTCRLREQLKTKQGINIYITFIEVSFHIATTDNLSPFLGMHCPIGGHGGTPLPVTGLSGGGEKHSCSSEVHLGCKGHWG